MTDIPYLTHLRKNLVTGIGQRQRRIARRRRAALVLTPLVLAATVVGTTLPGGSTSALAIEQDGDWIEVRITDATASATQMEAELQAAGIDAHIILAPTTAEHVGQWACIARFITPSSQSEAPPPQPSHTLRVTPEVLYVRRGFVDPLVIIIGRAPDAGEQPKDWPEVCGLGGRVVYEE